ncbi:thioester reductase domain-containing protein [Acinetobacter pragensis]|uniref:Carrier domain-containing protein n=1 Tax=Acinetobacter pragensis TaxID=1806892 RepID=A0A151Y5F3_9GAMM|nr:thioester reductase domain-containing protein [Acinetobacter pragensis]KYQ73263.1 hypothetical protein AZH43_07530 [Acinetobacter pragensis]
MNHQLSYLIGNKNSYLQCDLTKILDSLAITFPEKIAIKIEQESITYSELIKKAKSLAYQLRELDISIEEPIGILLEPSIESIIAQIGILFGGGTCIPLDRNQPTLRIQNILDNLRCKILITEDCEKNRLKISKILTISNITKRQFAEPSKTINLTLDHRTHILHTSGTTGTPKAVQILSKGIMRLAFNEEFCVFTPTDEVSHISNPTFDASLFEIYGTLLNGCTLHIIPKKTILSLNAFQEEIKNRNITIMAVTTALFNVIALSKPDAFKGVNSIIVGGEPANAYAMKQVLIHSNVENLRNGYGPTECTTYASTRHITLEYLNHNKNIDIGRPIANTDIFILNNQMEIVHKGDMGEIGIAGDGVSRSYANNDTENLEKFITITINGIEQKIYRTGDLGRINNNDFLECFGRKDNQIKIRGHRINLEEIEQEILHSKLVESVVVDIIKPIEIHHEPYIMAYVILKKEFSLFDLKDKLGKILPNYMLPRISLVPYIALNSNGKADKRKLFEMSDINKKIDTSDENHIIKKLRKLWIELLNYSSIDQYDDFFELGGSSLHVATLVIDIEKHFYVQIPIIELYENPTLIKLALLIESKINKIESVSIDNTVEILRNDGNLELPLFEKNYHQINWLSENEGNVFLTGSTGFLGAFFLNDLCKEDSIKAVYCLVRAKNISDGLEKIILNQKKYNLWDETYLKKIKVICGFLDQNLFGLTHTEYEKLSEDISCIFHLGAHVNYTQPYSVHKPANVTGTLNIIEFSINHRVKPLHYTSSIAAFGPTGFFNKVSDLSENEPLDKHLDCLRYDTGYSQSQWVAEKIMIRAQDEGLPINIYRPGFIMGDSKNGIGNEKDFVARFLKGCIEIGVFPKLEKQKKEFIAVDYVSSCLLNIAKKMCYQQCYNFVPLNPDDSINLIELHGYLLKYGYNLELVQYQEWINILEKSGDLNSNPLLPLLPMLKEPVYGSMTRWEVYENMPTYRTDNVKKALGNNLESPTLNQEILHKYLKYWIESNFIPSNIMKT